jgi:hypothetical protein
MTRYGTIRFFSGLLAITTCTFGIVGPREARAESASPGDFTSCMAATSDYSRCMAVFCPPPGGVPQGHMETTFLPGRTSVPDGAPELTDKGAPCMTSISIDSMGAWIFKECWSCLTVRPVFDIEPPHPVGPVDRARFDPFVEMVPPPPMLPPAPPGTSSWTPPSFIPPAP